MKNNKIYYLIILLFIIGGCTYSMTIEKNRDFINSNSKIPYLIFYVDDNFKMKKIWTVGRDGYTFKVDVGETLSNNIQMFFLKKSNPTINRITNIIKQNIPISTPVLSTDFKLSNIPKEDAIKQDIIIEI